MSVYNFILKPDPLFRILTMSSLRLRLTSFLRGLGIIVAAGAVALLAAYFADTLTRRETPAAITPTSVTPTEPAARTDPEPAPSAAERERDIDYALFGLHPIRYRIGAMLEKGDASLLCSFRTDFSGDLKANFGVTISREERDVPSRDAVESDLLRHFAGRKSQAYALYVASFDADREKAIRLMDELLALPEEERKPLEALAKYRRARLRMSLEDWSTLDDEATRLRLRVIREDLASVPGHVSQGSLDPSQIGENAAYWIAYSRSMILPSRRLVALGEADYAASADAYLRMPRRGDANAVNSCLHLLAKLCLEENLRPALGGENLRKLMTYYLTACGGMIPENRPDMENLRAASIAWLDLLAESKTDPGFALRHVAILQYNCGRWQDCRATASRLPSDDPLRHLLLSRCNLRLTGDPVRSRTLLEGAAPAPDVGPSGESAPVTTSFDYDVLIDLRDDKELRERVRGERGALALCAGDFAEALRLFDEGRYGEDAFYVAECLLPLDELKAYVDTRRAAGQPLSKYRWSYVATDFDDIEFALCSRLMRAGRMEEALDYVRPELRAKATSYVLLRRAAERGDVSARERADSFWRAALLIGQIGETVLHCPHGVSWTSGEGWYVSQGYLPGFRSRSFDFKYPVPEMKLLACGEEELRRVRAWESVHMTAAGRPGRDARYAAFDLALKAVQLLPDNDPAGAQILQYAGNLLKYREPKAANPAYRLLVTRFKDTPYGAHALKARWFSAERPVLPADLLSR